MAGVPQRAYAGRSVLRLFEERLLRRQLRQPAAQETALHVIGRKRECAAVCLGGLYGFSQAPQQVGARGRQKMKFGKLLPRFEFVEERETVVGSPRHRNGDGPV